VPRVTTVKIAAIVSVGYQELDRLWLFVPLNLSLQMFDSREEPVFWGIKGDFPLPKTPDFLNAVRGALGSSWQAVSWQTTGRSQFLNYQATRALLAVVMALILLVAAVNVSTAMVTTVTERRRETAVLKALGASDTLVQQQFLILGLGGGLAGALVGVGLGMGVALGIDPLVRVIDGLVSLFTPGRGFHLLSTAFYLESSPVRFDPAVLLAAGGGAVGLAVAASWWPARRAARERPLEVLRRA
jgi:lipoprotein-releasing system permease protein